MKALMYDNKYLFFFSYLHTKNSITDWLKANLDIKVTNKVGLSESYNCEVINIADSNTIVIRGDEDYFELDLIDVPIEI